MGGRDPTRGWIHVHENVDPKLRETLVIYEHPVVRSDYYRRFMRHVRHEQAIVLRNLEELRELLKKL